MGDARNFGYGDHRARLNCGGRIGTRWCCDNEVQTGTIV